MQISDLPHLNVSLNALSAVLLTTGYWAIKTRRVSLHKGCMIAAMTAAGAFLVSYVIYHTAIGGGKKYTGEGILRTVYFAILIPHVVLAAVNLPMVIVTATRAFKGDFERHKKIARITFPLWAFVSVSGVVVYLMLYVWM
ncbi:MAG: hypothetical protein DHS20C16_17620 [Phycisphaerae bacterium]|nr:MAG: hypothetical protein DHS20C16_17620 [Phycisphaerae bacterium]